MITNTKELYTGTPNSDIRKLCTVHCGRNVNKPRAPTRVEGKGLQFWCDITVQQKNKLERILMIFGFLVNMVNTIVIYSYSTTWALFPQKWCVAPEFFVLISSHCRHRFDAWDMAVPGLQARFKISKTGFNFQTRNFFFLTLISWKWIQKTFSWFFYPLHY